MTTKIDLAKKRGDTRRIVFKIRDKANKPIDITNWTNFLLTINSEKSPIDISNQLDQLTGFVVDAINGRVGFSPSGTVAIGKHFYDAQGTDDNSEIYTFSEGKFDITQDITK